MVPGWVVPSALSLLAICFAEKDSSYYPNGSGNKNIDLEMYWRDSNNVLDDLNSFDILYISYEGCSLTSYDDNGEKNCGKGDFWYEGCSEWPFRPGISYVLYGILKGQEDVGCGRSSFINSFITTSGPEDFIEALVSTGASFSSYSNDENSAFSSECTVYEGSGNQNSYSHGAKIYDGATSSGLGCSKKSFVLQSFRGAYCNAYNVIQTTNDLSSFNNDLSNTQCKPIYKRQNGNNDAAKTILGVSRACSKLEGSACPDPWGILGRYERRLYQSSTAIQKIGNIVRAAISLVLFISGILFLFQALIMYRERKQNSQPKNKFRRKKQKDTVCVKTDDLDYDGKRFGWRIRRFFSRFRRSRLRNEL